ncbi:MAG: hypothetical protein IPJ79_01475 [Bacteroidetes bacterium]|nr:hypothetical protein [Bacteroidota bacterium]
MRIHHHHFFFSFFYLINYLNQCGKQAAILFLSRKEIPYSPLTKNFHNKEYNLHARFSFENNLINAEVTFPASQPYFSRLSMLPNSLLATFNN